MKKIKLIHAIVRSLVATEAEKQGILNELKKRYKAMDSKQRADINKGNLQKIIDLIQPQLDVKHQIAEGIQKKYLEAKTRNEKQNRSKTNKK